MRNAPLISLFIFLLFVSSLIFNFFDYLKKEEEERHTFRLQQAVTYSTTAAIDYMLENGRDIRLNNEDMESMTFNPELALEEFVDMFLFNYKLPLTEENRYLVKTRYISLFCVVVYDGYYIATVKRSGQDADGTAYDLVFTPKLPFTYYNGAIAYGLTLGSRNHWRVNGNTVKYMKDSLPPGVPDVEDARYKINIIVSQHLYKEIALVNATNPNWDIDWIIPQGISRMTSVNSITGPTVIAMIQNFSIDSSKNLSAFSVGGSMIQEQKLLVGYIENGKRLYCYSHEYPGEKEKISAIFNSEEEAALNGYWADVRYIFSK